MVTAHGPVTIIDVARLAGVSPGTASKALNGRGGISARTATRVQQAAERLGYQPNALARGLLTGRSFTVGLITTDSFGRFSIPVVQGAEDALGPGRILVFLCESRDDRLREQHYLQALLERRVDGIIVTGRRQDRREPAGTCGFRWSTRWLTRATPLISRSCLMTRKGAPWLSVTCSAWVGRLSVT
jgi:LacI family transcriptional regulator